MTSLKSVIELGLHIKRTESSQLDNQLKYYIIILTISFFTKKAQKANLCMCTQLACYWLAPNLLLQQGRAKLVSQLLYVLLFINR